MLQTTWSSRKDVSNQFTQNSSCHYLEYTSSLYSTIDIFDNKHCDRPIAGSKDCLSACNISIPYHHPAASQKPFKSLNLHLGLAYTPLSSLFAEGRTKLCSLWEYGWISKKITNILLVLLIEGFPPRMCLFACSEVASYMPLSCTEEPDLQTTMVRCEPRGWGAVFQSRMKPGSTWDLALPSGGYHTKVVENLSKAQNGAQCLCKLQNLEWCKCGQALLVLLCRRNFRFNRSSPL